MFSYSHAADGSKSVYLVVMTLTSTGDTEFIFNYHEVPTMDKCFDLVKNSKIGIPQGGDAEAAVVIYCTPTPAKIWKVKQDK